jgi:hypothetical protein
MCLQHIGAVDDTVSGHYGQAKDPG